jgi:hypothetical protein
MAGQFTARTGLRICLERVKTCAPHKAVVGARYAIPYSGRLKLKELMAWFVSENCCNVQKVFNSPD